MSSSGWWTCKSLWFGTDSPNCIQSLTTIVSLQPPSSIRTSTRTGTWVHTGGEEVAGFTRCRGLAQGPSYDWLGDWDMSLSMISFTVKGDKQKFFFINIQNFKYIILSEHVHFFPAEVSVVPPWVPHRTKIANSNCQKLKMGKKNTLKNWQTQRSQSHGSDVRYNLSWHNKWEKLFHSLNVPILNRVRVQEMLAVSTAHWLL